MIVAMAAEPCQFNNLNGGVNFNTTTATNKYNNSASRFALEFPHQISQYELPLGSVETEIWLRLFLYCGEFTSNGESVNIITFYNSSTHNDVVTLTAYDYVFNLQQFKLKFNGVDVTGSEFVLVKDTANFIDIRYTRGASGKLEVYKSDSLMCDITIDTTALAGVNSIIFKTVNSSNFDNIALSEIIVDNADSTIGKRLATLIPNATGAMSEWNGTYADIDESELDMSDYISTTSINKKFTSNYSNLNIEFIDYTVDAVELTSIMRLMGTSSVNDLQHVVRSGGSNYNSSNLALTKNGSVQTKKTMYLINPDTASKWLRTEVDGAEFGVESV
jgi:hypothetical protein